MSKTFHRVVNIVFAVLLATFSVNLTGVLSLQTAHADNGTYQPVWCKLTGNSWQAQLAANGNGKNGPLLMTESIRSQELGNVDNSVVDGNQVYAHDRDSKLDAACAQQFTLTAPIPTITGVCGLNNDTATVPNNPEYTWNFSGWTASKGTITVTATSPYSFSTGKSVTIPVTEKDTSACVTTITTLPVSIVAPVCGPNNDVITVGAATSQYSAGVITQPFTNGIAKVTYTAKQGFVFPGGGTTYVETVNEITTANCTDATASITPIAATCNANGSATFAVAHASLTSNGGVLDKTPGNHTATFTADAGHAFANGQTTATVNYSVPAMLTGAVCAGPQPSNDVQTQTVTNPPVCSPNGGGTVTSYTEQRTRTYVISGNSWVPGPWSAWTEVPGSEKTVPATAEQCPTTVTPTDPTFKDVCGGLDDDTFTIPTTTGVTYYIKTGLTYTVIKAGTYPAFGTVTIKAVVQKGYMLAQGATTVWTNPFNSNSCPVTATAPTSVDQCGTANDTYTIPTTDHVTYKKLVGYFWFVPIYQTITAGTYPGSGTVKIIAVASDDYTIDGQSSWTFTFDSTPCDQAVTPTAPTATDECGTSQDGYTIPTTTGVTYEVNGQPVTAGFHAATGTVTITAVPQKGYYLSEDGDSSWTFTFTNVACPCTPSTVTLQELTLSTMNTDTNDNCTPGQGGAGGETPSTPSTPATPTVVTTPVTELPDTGPADGNTAVKLATIVFAGIATYGAMYFVVNRRRLLQK